MVASGVNAMNATARFTNKQRKISPVATRTALSAGGSPLMAPRRSLADKYAQSRRDQGRPDNGILDSSRPDSSRPDPSTRDVYPQVKPYFRRWPQDPSLVESRSSNYNLQLSRYPRKSLSQKYETHQRRREPKLTNPPLDSETQKLISFGTHKPFGHDPKNPFSYSTQEKPLSDPILKPKLNTWRVAKPASKKTRGIMSKVKDFLGSFRLDSLDWNSADYKPLENSISSLEEPLREVFRAVPSTSAVQETVDYNKIFDIRDSKRQSDFDEVAQALEQRRTREHEAKLERLKVAMQQKLEAEHTKRCEAERDYERKLYLLKTGFDARMHSIEERMEAMKREADEHSKVLRAQSTAELMEQKEAIYMHQIEASTKIRNLNSLVAEKEQEMERMREKLEQLSRDMPQAGAGAQDNDQIIRSILDNAEGKNGVKGSDGGRGHRNSVDTDGITRHHQGFLDRETKQNETAVIQLYEALQRSPGTVEDGGRLLMLGSLALSRKVEHLLQALDAKVEPLKVTSQLDDYEHYFDSCIRIKNKDPRHLSLLYQEQSLDGMENYFLQVVELTKGKLRKYESRIQRLNQRIQGRSSNPLTLKGAQKITSLLESRTRLLFLYKQNVGLLMRLGEVMKKMSEVRVVLQSATERRLNPENSIATS